MLSTPCRSVREVLNHTALKPDLVIRAMYRQDKIYQDPCTSRVKNYQDCVQIKQELSGLCTDRFIIIRILSFFP